MVLGAGGNGPERELALERFCRMYWYPVYAFVRRNGAAPEDARDLAQGFFAHMIEKGWLAEAKPRDTRFSTLLLTILKRFIISARRDAGARKRGGGATLVSLDAAQAEEWFGAEPATGETPEKTFGRRWAIAVLAAAHAALRQRAAAAGKALHFELLGPFLAREAVNGEYETIAPQLGLSARNVAVSVHRLRGQYREALRDELGAGAIPASQVDEELRHLAAALR